MQIRNGCNALNIAGNPIKDINAKLSFLSSGSNVVEWIPHWDIRHSYETASSFQFQPSQR